MSISINACFDGGNIQCLQCDSPHNIRLKILPDAGHEFFQWFYFRVSHVRDRALCLKIVNAAQAAFTDGWEGYEALASYDLVLFDACLNLYLELV